jgi:hypothetical protein
MEASMEGIISVAILLLMAGLVIRRRLSLATVADG